MIDNEQKPTRSQLFSTRLATNGSLDFCIWVLARDGLQVPPFTHHTRGEAMLSSLGFDAEGWESWVRNIVVKEDPRLRFKIEEDTDSYVERKVQEFMTSLHVIEDAAENEESYSDEHRAIIKQSLQNWKENEARELANLHFGYRLRAACLSQQYQQGLAAIEQLPKPIQEL